MRFLRRGNHPGERDWQTVTFAFLPDDFDRLEELIAAIGDDPQLVVVAPGFLEGRFNDAMREYAQVRGFRSGGLALASMIKLARDWVAISQARDGLADERLGGADEWVDLENVLMSTQIPAGAALVIMEGVAKLIRKREISEDHWWQALERWAAQELAR